MIRSSPCSVWHCVLRTIPWGSQLWNNWNCVVKTQKAYYYYCHHDSYSRCSSTRIKYHEGVVVGTFPPISSRGHTAAAAATEFMPTSKVSKCRQRRIDVTAEKCFKTNVNMMRIITRRLHRSPEVFDRYDRVLRYGRHASYSCASVATISSARCVAHLKYWKPTFMPQWFAISIVNLMPSKYWPAGCGYGFVLFFLSVCLLKTLKYNFGTCLRWCTICKY